MASSAGLVLPPAKAGAVVEQRWAYFCFARDDVDQLNDMANGAGARGWEMVAAASSAGKDGKPIWCFRQPRP